MCTCSIASLPNADVIKNHLNMMEPGTGLGMVDHVAGGLPGGRGIVRRLSSSMGPNGASIAEESIGLVAEASLSDGQVRHVLIGLDIVQTFNSRNLFLIPPCS